MGGSGDEGLGGSEYAPNITRSEKTRKRKATGYPQHLPKKPDGTRIPERRRQQGEKREKLKGRTRGPSGMAVGWKKNTIAVSSLLISWGPEWYGVGGKRWGGG